MFYIAGRQLPDAEVDATFTALANGFFWAAQPKGTDFYILVYKLSGEQYVQHASAIIKTAQNQKPNLLQASESGVFAIISFSDYHYKNGEAYVMQMNQKAKIVVERIKQLEKPVSAVCFQYIYNNLYGNSQARESFDDSPEFLLGTSIGEIFIGQMQKKKIRLQFLRSMRASTYMSFQGNDCNAIKCIQALNVNNKSQLTFPGQGNFYSNSAFDKVNVTIVIICCGIVCEMYIYSCSSFWQLTLDEATSFYFHELYNLAIGENLPLFYYYKLQFAAEKLQFFWLVQSFMGKNFALQRIVFSFDEIIRSACIEAMRAAGLDVSSDERISAEMPNIHSLPEFPPKCSLQAIQGVQQLRGAMLDLKTEDAVLGFWVSDYHLLIVLSSYIIVLNLISQQKTESMSNGYASEYQARFALRQTANRADNYTPFENCYVAYTGAQFDSFGDIMQKKSEFPAPCSYYPSVINYMTLPASVGRGKTTSLAYLKAGDETINLWRYYLAQEDFDNAMKFSRSMQDENVIKRQQAEYYLTKGNGWAAAQLLAESDCNMVVQFRELIKIKKFDVCNWFMERRLALIFQYYEAFKKPIVYSQDKLDMMDFDSKCEYYQVCNEYTKIQNLRYLAVQLRIEALIVSINCLQKEQERLGVDLYSFYGIEEQPQLRINERKIGQAHIDSLLRNKEELVLFITSKQSAYYPYIIKNILQNSLINANLDFIYAQYCTSTNDTDFTINFHVYRYYWDDAVSNLRNAPNEQFLTYLDKIIVHRPHECFGIIQNKIENMRTEFRYNLLFPVLRQHLVELRQHVLDFCRWLCFTLKVKNELAVTFVINSLAQLGEEDTLLVIIREFIECNTKVDLMYVLYAARNRKLKNVEVDCLYRLNRHVDALELQFKSFNSVPLSEIKNIENSQKNWISLGSLERVFDSFNQLMMKLTSVDFYQDKRVLYLNFFKWFMNITIVWDYDLSEVKQSQMLHQIRYRQLQRVFTLIETVPFLTQLDGIQQIPAFFNVAMTRQLTNDLALFNYSRAGEIEQVISSSAEVLETNQRQIQQQSKRVVSVYGELSCCQMCAKKISAVSDMYVTAHGVCIFPCGHCWHTSCFVKYHSLKGRHGSKELIQKWRAFERENPQQVYSKGTQIVQELVKKCPKCSDESIDRCLDPI